MLIFITVRNSSCGKVMFSQASVILSTEGGHAWGGACVVGGCVAGGHAWRGGMCGRGVCMARGVHGNGGGMCGREACVAGEGACMAGGVHSRGAWMVGNMHGGVAGGMCGRGACMESGRRDSHCSRQYASYWNAFLLHTCWSDLMRTTCSNAHHVTNCFQIFKFGCKTKSRQHRKE